MPKIDLDVLQRLCDTMDIEPEQKRAVDCPFMRDDMGTGPDSVWWYVTDVSGEKLIACAQEEHAEFVAAAITALPQLIARIRELEAGCESVAADMLKNDPCECTGYAEDLRDLADRKVT